MASVGSGHWGIGSIVGLVQHPSTEPSSKLATARDRTRQLREDTLRPFQLNTSRIEFALQSALLLGNAKPTRQREHQSDPKGEQQYKQLTHSLFDAFFMLPPRMFTQRSKKSLMILSLLFGVIVAMTEKAPITEIAAWKIPAQLSACSVSKNSI